MIFTGADRLGVAGLRDLPGLRVGVEREGLPFQLLQAHPDIITTPVPDLTQGFALLAKGQVDAVIADRWVGAYLLARDRIGGVRMVREPVARSESAIAVRKGDTNSSVDINAGMTTLRRSGEYEAILDRWRPKEVVFTTREQLRRQAWVTAGIFALLLAALGSVVLLVREIRRRRHIETALRESEARFHLALNNSPVLVAMQDADLVYRWAFNTRTRQSEEVLGKTDADLFAREDMPSILEAKRRVLEDGEVVRHALWLTSNGQCVFLDCNYEPVRDSAGKIIGIGIAAVNLTAQKRAEEALRESEARFRAAFEQGAIAMSIATLDGRLLKVNPAYCTLFGYSEEELTSGSFYTITLPDDLAVNRAGIARIVNGEAFSFRMEKRYIHKDGSLIWGDMSTVAERDADGRPHYSVTHILDITERKQAEKALQASLHEKEVLLKEIHHRVKNNMQVISSLVSLQADTLDNPALQPLFNDLRDRVRTMALVHEKLYQSESLANMDFAEYTRSLLNYLWRAHGDATANVRLTLDVQPVSLSMEQAVPCGLLLNELVTNALKHAFRDRDDGELTRGAACRPGG